jgi:membrane protease YdiL (CAAX protease family)
LDSTTLTFENPSCKNCGSLFLDESIFCKKCGSKRIELIREERAKDESYRFNLKQFSSYSILVLVLLSLAAITNDTFVWDILWTLIFACVSVVYAFKDRETFSLVFPKELQLKPLIYIIIITIFSGILIHFLVSVININIFSEEYSLLYDEEDTSFPLLVSLISVAIFPAIFEELAFRGFLFNNLTYLSGSKGAIFGTAFLFTIVHFSILSFFWLFPFGLLLGYIRSRHSTLIYGMIGHFVHNSTIIIIEYILLK